MAGRPWVEQVTLEGSVARLEPLTLEHLPGLTAIGLDADIWRWMPTAIQTPGEMRGYIDRALAAREVVRKCPSRRSKEQAAGSSAGLVT